MKSPIEQQKLIFNYIIKHPEYFKTIGSGFFGDTNVEMLSTLAKNFYMQYSSTPTCEQMKQLALQSGKEIDVQIIESIYNISFDTFDKEWIKRTVEDFICYNSFEKNLIKAVEYSRSMEVDATNIRDVINKSVEIIDLTKTINFDNDYGFNFFDPSLHKTMDEKKTPTSFDFINKALGGGVTQKTLNCYLGAPNVGKSVFLCNDAANFVRRGKNVVYITCEMSPQDVARRVAANLFNITLDEYDKALTMNDGIKKIMDRYNSGNECVLVPHGKFFIKEYPTSTATVMDVENYVKELEEYAKLKIDILIIDYIGIMCNYRNQNSENTYIKIKQLCEDVRAIAVRRELTIFTAMQIGRESFNATTMTIKDVAESTALIHTCDNIFGIIQDDQMYRDNEYFLKILKIRRGKGKNVLCKLSVNYEKMKLLQKEEATNMDDYMEGLKSPSTTRIKQSTFDDSDDSEIIIKDYHESSKNEFSQLSDESSNDVFANINNINDVTINKPSLTIGGIEF